MIILADNEPWPTDEVRDFADAFGQGTVTRPRSSKYVVCEALANWINKTPVKPTHLKIPFRLERDFKNNIAFDFELRPFPTIHSSDDEFLGLKVVYSKGNSMELLTGETEY